MALQLAVKELTPTALKVDATVAGAAASVAVEPMGVNALGTPFQFTAAAYAK